jgi:hypothetical protein
MIPEAARWYKASGMQDCVNACCIFECMKYAMPKRLKSRKPEVGYRYKPNVGHDRAQYVDDEGSRYFSFGWDYSAAQLGRLGYIGDAIEIYRFQWLHNKKGREAETAPAPSEGVLLLQMLLVCFDPFFSSQAIDRLS